VHLAAESMLRVLARCVCVMFVCSVLSGLPGERGRMQRIHCIRRAGWPLGGRPTDVAALTRAVGRRIPTHHDRTHRYGAAEQQASDTVSSYRRRERAGSTSGLGSSRHHHGRSARRIGESPHLKACAPTCVAFISLATAGLWSRSAIPLRSTAFHARPKTHAAEDLSSTCDERGTRSKLEAEGGRIKLNHSEQAGASTAHLASDLLCDATS